MLSSLPPSGSRRTAIVSGAGSGIGRACAHKLLNDGFSVGLIGRRQHQLDETAEGYDQALVFSCDVTDPVAVEEAFCHFRKTWKHLDVLFNNAGINIASGLIDEISISDWLKVQNINVTGSFLCARNAFRWMRAQRPQGGRIINNGSISAHAPRAGSTAYAVSKHAITGLTRSISLDGRPFNIVCGQIDIGNAQTEMVARMAAGAQQSDGDRPTEPTMDVAHVADAVLQMAALPLSANVQFMTLMASSMPYIGRG